MSQKVRYQPERLYPAHWVVDFEAVLLGQQVVPGNRLRIAGEKGTFRFIKYVLSTETEAEWCDVVGGAPGCTAYRSFRPEKVVEVIGAKDRVNTDLVVSIERTRSPRAA